MPASPETNPRRTDVKGLLYTKNGRRTDNKDYPRTKLATRSSVVYLEVSTDVSWSSFIS